MKKSVVIAAVVLALGTAGAAVARDRNKDAVEARKAAFTLMGANFGPMGAMVKGEMPFDKDAFAKRAANLQALADMPWEFFIPGSDKGHSESKPEVWSKPDEFKAKADDFKQAAIKLVEVSKQGDQEAIGKQFGATAKTCKSCHKAFKNK